MTLAKFISGITSPFLVLTVFGVAVLHYYAIDWQQFVIWACLFFLFCVLIPFAFIVLQIRRGLITDIHVAVREQRDGPFFVASVGAFLLLISYVLLRTPAEVVALAAALLVSGIFFALVTRYWKVSVHAAVWTGSVVMLAELIDPKILWLLLVMPIIIWARLIRQKHDVYQVVGAAALVVACITATLWIVRQVL